MFLAAAALTAHVAGCGPAEPKREYAAVTGTVTYKGEALTTGKIIFQPVSGPVGVGDINADGTYSLKGEIGPNTVMITSYEGDPSEEAENKGPPPESLIPPHYGTPNSGLQFDVEPGENTADFDLK